MIIGTDFAVHKVLISEDEYVLRCGDSVSRKVQWFYQQQQDDTRIPIEELGDTGYIISPFHLDLVNIKAEHEGFYSCDQTSTIYHVLVVGKWRRNHYTINCTCKRYTTLSPGLIVSKECYVTTSQHSIYTLH